MARIIYVNGSYLPHDEAVVHVEDRGYMLADGVYEGFELRHGEIIDMDRHLDRLWRSMGEIAISPPQRSVLSHVLRETVRRNRYKNGFVYLQVTRGVAPRDFFFPSNDKPPSIVCLVYNIPAGRADRLAEKGIQVITQRDIRWQRPDIKTLQLLPGVLARQAAFEQGASEAWLLDSENRITEGAASNAWIVSQDNQLITRQADQSILKGITRQAVLDLVEMRDLTFSERGFSLEEAYAAKEAFITSASMTVMPVVKIDDRLVGDGRPGPLTKELRKLYHQRTVISA